MTEMESFCLAFPTPSYMFILHLPPKCCVCGLLLYFCHRLFLLQSLNQHVHHQQSLPFFSSLLRPLIVLLCRGVFFMGGFSWITVRGVRVSSKEAPILAVAPHSSFFDSLALVYMDLTSVVAKTESKHIPCFGSRLFSCSFVPSVFFFLSFLQPPPPPPPHSFLVDRTFFLFFLVVLWGLF